MTTIKQLAANATRGPRESLAFDPDKLPIKVGLWYVALAPVRPRTTSDGGIELPANAQQAESYLISIGKVLDMGDFAWKSKTPAGLDLATDSRCPKKGDYVLYAQHSGTRVQMRDGRMLVIVSDTEIIGVMDPEEVSNVQFYI